MVKHRQVKISNRNERLGVIKMPISSSNEKLSKNDSLDSKRFSKLKTLCQSLWDFNTYRKNKLG